MSNNARDDLFNGPHAPTFNGVSRNAVEAGMAQAECRAAIDEFNRELPSFCRRLGIPPAVLALPTPTLLMIICMRLAAENDTLAARIDALTLTHGDDQ